MSKEEIEKLFAMFETSHSAWKKAKELVETQYAKQSEIVKQIAAAVAPEKKIRYKGQTLTIVCRPFKDGSGESWFFRGLSDDKDIMEIGGK